MAPVSRRSVPRGLLAISVGGVATSALSGCGALTGFATTGGSGMTFFSTQFAPVEEAERFRGILSADGYLTDLLAGLGWPDEFLDLARVGTERTWYVPWAQLRVTPTQTRWYDPETQLLLEDR